MAEADIEPDSGESTASEATPPSRAKRFGTVFGRALSARLPALSVTIVAGLALCVSFPPFGWWYAAILAFALLGWVLTRPSTTAAGGLGYGLLFGLVFYLPLLPWISGLVGALPWLMLSLLEALFPGPVRPVRGAGPSLPGWPLWFAGLWSAQEWLKSTVPFGGFPWGVVGFSQIREPDTAARVLRRRSAGVVRRGAARLQRVGDGAGGHPLVAGRRRGPGRGPARGRASRAVYQPGVAVDGARVAPRAEVRRRRR